jgi:hypothetical protein
MASTYSKDNDVEKKYSHLTIPTKVAIADFQDDAYNYINGRLRKLYTVPIVSSDNTDKGILKLIEASLAAGNILMAVAAVHEADGVHKYGQSLVDLAEEKLTMLEDQEMVLTGAPRDADSSDDVANAPLMSGSSADDYATFDRPMSGIENDAIEGTVDSEKYNEVEDNVTL